MASAYTRHRFRLGSRFTTELGTRFGTASWTKDRFIEPRVNAAYQLGNSTALRAGWGHFHQVQGIEQLDVQDGDFNFYKAQRAEHMVLGLEHLFDDVLVPMEKVVEVRRGRKVDAERKFFPGYVLVKMDMTNEAFHLIKDTPKVTGFLGADQKPMPIPDSYRERFEMILEDR